MKTLMNETKTWRLFDWNWLICDSLTLLVEVVIS